MEEKKEVGEGNDKSEKVPATMLISTDREIAMDFAIKVYEKFDQLIKSIVLFGSSAKGSSNNKSDIDIIIILDDVSIMWDDVLIGWYREELGKIIKRNPYRKELHINSVRLSTWWADLIRGDPVIINILRFGDALIDFGGFFSPLKVLLKEGKIKPTPEAIYTLLQRSPTHMNRARQFMLSSVEALYWTMVDSAHAALISADILPCSPGDIPNVLREKFVKEKRLEKKYVSFFEEIYKIEKEIVYGKKNFLKGKYIDELFNKADSFLCEMARLVDEEIKNKSKN